MVIIDEQQHGFVNCVPHHEVQSDCTVVYTTCYSEAIGFSYTHIQIPSSNRTPILTSTSQTQIRLPFSHPNSKLKSDSHTHTHISNLNPCPILTFKSPVYTYIYPSKQTIKHYIMSSVTCNVKQLCNRNP